ncbi:hypothetical protein AB0E71_28390 [Streptomyces narbonensis]|uniref:hypothetical protein n=1 Tax=Streptomyces narbonensis TaxID=67333 RepID=UPI0033FE86EA
MIFSPETLVQSGAGPAPVDAAAERQALMERWAERHGVDAARRLAEAEDLADAVAKAITPENTTETYDKMRVRGGSCLRRGRPQVPSSTFRVSKCSSNSLHQVLVGARYSPSGRRRRRLSRNCW